MTCSCVLAGWAQPPGSCRGGCFHCWPERTPPSPGSLKWSAPSGCHIGCMRRRCSCWSFRVKVERLSVCSYTARLRFSRNSKLRSWASVFGRGETGRSPRPAPPGLSGDGPAAGHSTRSPHGFSVTRGYRTGITASFRGYLTTQSHEQPPAAPQSR